MGCRFAPARRRRAAVRAEVLYGELAFAPDGHELAVATGMSTPLVFNLDVNDWAARACALSPTCRDRPASGPAAAGSP